MLTHWPYMDLETIYWLADRILNLLRRASNVDVVGVVACFNFAFMLFYRSLLTRVMLWLSWIAHEGHIACHECLSCWKKSRSSLNKILAHLNKIWIGIRWSREYTTINVWRSIEWYLRVGSNATGTHHDHVCVDRVWIELEPIWCV